MTSDARAAYEAIYAEWLAAKRLAALHKTTAERLEGELNAMASAEQKRNGGNPERRLEPDSVFGKRKE